MKGDNTKPRSNDNGHWSSIPSTENGKAPDFNLGVYESL